MPNLKKNTFHTSGILNFSSGLRVSLFFLLVFQGISWAQPPSYEIQFHTNKLHGKLDYSYLKDIGIDTVIYRVFLDDEKEGGLYFSNTQFKIIDLSLDKLIEEYDFKKVKLCAWMIARKFNWLDAPRFQDWQYENGKRRITRKFDIFNPDAVQIIIQVYKELASMKLDSILIQDDFSLRFNEGFSNWGKAQFSKQTGELPREELMIQKNTPYNRSWNRVKATQLARVLDSIVTNCKSVNTAVKIGMNIYYETPLFPDRAEAWYGQNLDYILETGVDYIYLMAYHRQMKDELKLSEAETRDTFRQMVEKAYEKCKEKLIVKIQIRDWKTSERIPSTEIQDYLDLIPAGVRRICFTPVTLDSDDFDYVARIIRSARKIAASGGQNPFCKKGFAFPKTFNNVYNKEFLKAQAVTDGVFRVRTGLYSNQKFLEVQEPFYKKVPGLRSQARSR